jgi:hypothetical protein
VPGRRGAGAAWTLEFTLLVEEDAQLFLEAHAPQQLVQGDAAGDAVFGAVGASVRRRHQMFDAGFFRGKVLVAEKAPAPLCKQQSV